MGCDGEGSNVRLNCRVLEPARASGVRARQLASFLDGLGHEQRVAAVRSLGRAEQRKLYAAVEGFLPVRLPDLVPPAVGDFVPVRHFGRNTLPDIIVLDVLMEGVGGLGFLEWFRGRHKIDLPIVVFTSSENPELKRQCLALGAAAFKVKPTDFTELVDVVHGVLDRWNPQRDKDSGQK